VLVDQGIPQRKKRSVRPRKMTNILLKCAERKISKYPSMKAGLLRATVQGVAALSGCIYSTVER
jgi:hypothetical protein